MLGKPRIHSGWLLAFLALSVLTLAITPSQTQAIDAFDICEGPLGPDPNVDSDGDGFWDDQECNEIQHYNGFSTDGWTSADPEALNRMHPTRRDLFVVLHRVTPGSLLPSDDYECLKFVTNFQQDPWYGLGIAVHVIPWNAVGPHCVPATPCPMERRVDVNNVSWQKAVRIAEDHDENGDILGVACYGTPNDLDEARIYTKRIINHIKACCAKACVDQRCDNHTLCAGCQCEDIDGDLLGNDLFHKYMKNTVAHEVGHMLKLTKKYEKRFGGYHHKAGTYKVMEEFITHTSKGGGKEVTFYISTQFEDPASTYGTCLTDDACPQ